MKQFNKYEFLTELREDLILSVPTFIHVMPMKMSFKTVLTALYTAILITTVSTMPIVGQYATSLLTMISRLTKRVKRQKIFKNLLTGLYMI